MNNSKFLSNGKNQMINTSDSEIFLAVHQPNFIPWLGYFDKIAQSDIFVLLDTVQYPRSKSVANRNIIKTKSGALEIVVPIAHPKGSQRLSTYKEVAIADEGWKKKALNSITHAYGPTPYFNQIFALISRCFNQPSFASMNTLFIHEVVRELGINTKIINLSDLSSADGVNNSLIISICKEVGGQTYLSGKGASAYNDESMYNENGLKLIYQSYSPKICPQINGDFIPNLSVIDALFNLGVEGTKNVILDKK